MVLSLVRILRQLKRLRPGTVEMPLLWVMHAVSEHEPVRLSELATRLYLDLSTISRHVSALESQGLLVRTPDPEDRRASLVSLTEEGRRLHREFFEQRRQRLTEMVADWPEKDLETFERLLCKLADRLEEADEGGDQP